MLLRVLCLFLSLALGTLHLEATPQTVLIVGYAETDAEDNLDSNGVTRAEDLPGYFASLSSQGIGLPDIIFTSLRSLSLPGHAVGQTATPTSTAIKQPIHTYPSSNPQGLVNRILTNPACNDKVVLIVWDIANIPDLVAAFGYQAPVCPSGTCSALTYVLGTFPGTGEVAQPVLLEATVMNQDLLPGDVSCGGINAPTPPTTQAVAGYIPITIYNGTTSAIVNGVAQPITDSQIYVLALTNGNANVMQFTSDGNGHMLGSTMVPVPTQGNPSTYYTSNYSYPLSAFPSASAGFYTLYIPVNTELPSSRIYFSLVNPIDWFITSTGGIMSQDGNFVTSTDSYYTLYDKVEFTVTHVNLPWWQLVMNSTMVDYYCLPLSFYVNEIVSGTNTTLYTGLSPAYSRQNVFATYNTNLAILPNSGAGTWTSLYSAYTPVNTTTPVNLRIASANTGALKPTYNTSIFPKDYLTNNPNSSCEWYTSLWTQYYNVNSGNHTIVVDLSNAGAGAGTATGQVDGSGNFVFTINNSTLWPSPSSVTFQPPQTVAPFFSGSYTDYVNPTNAAPLYSSSGNANGGALEAVWQIFSCAFNVGFVPPPSGVGTVSNPLTKSYMQGQVANFFQNNPALCPGPWYNFYSQVLHTQLKQSPYVNYYTAPFDDYLGIDGTIFVNDTTGVNQGANVNVTLGDMTNSVIPNILNDSTIYNVVLSLPAHVSNVTFNGTAVTSSGPVGQAAGSNMTITLQYPTGPYVNTTFTAKVSPSTATTVPLLPYPANIVLSGNTVTVYLGGSP